METNILCKRKDFQTIPHRAPSLSIVLPFEPKMSSRTVLQNQMNMVLLQAEQESEKAYGPYITELLISKLKHACRAVNFSSFKKSIVILVSLNHEEVLYYDIDVKTSINTDTPFNLKNTLLQRPDHSRYLVVLLKPAEGRILLSSGDPGQPGNFRTVTMLRHPMQKHGREYEGLPGYDSNKEVPASTFLLYACRKTAELMELFGMPVVVSGTREVIHLFKQISNPTDVFYYPLDGDAGLNELCERLSSHRELLSWDSIWSRHLISQLEEAAATNTLVDGLPAVWRAAAHKKGRLLLIEESYCYPRQRGGCWILDNIPTAILPIASYIKDAIDDTINHVLINGGEVELVADGVLANHGHISLVCLHHGAWN